MLVIALVLYFPLVLIELVMSPQLHRLLYGFHPHSFEQQIRGGGFRAMVFTGHGLVTANIYLGGFIALLILFKIKRYIISKSYTLILIAAFSIALIFLRSLTAVVFAALALIILYGLGNRIRGLAVKGIFLFAIVYPVIITLNLLPLDYLYDTLQQIFPAERLESLFFRLFNESLFIDYLDRNLLIGYGGMGRAMLSGGVVDGTWLVWVMRYGIIFWIVNVFIYSIYLYRVKARSKTIIWIFSVLPMLMLLDQLPNSTWKNPWVWLYAGALIRLCTIYSQSEKFLVSKESRVLQVHCSN